MKRSLTAILFADAVGYSRHMRESEQLAVRSIVFHISAIKRLLAEYGGTHGGGAGDSVLATFGSAREAVRCAIAIQSRERASDDLLNIQFRIGIHLGDMVEVDGELHGDSVNVASRLESIAAPGGINVSRSVYDALRGQTDFAFVSAGRPKLKNIGEDLEVFTVVHGLAAGITSEGQVSPPSWHGLQQPSIAVLPFECVSERDDLAILASGFAEELIGYMTRFRSLDVIARGSSIFKPSQSIAPNETIARLNVSYIVQGRVQLSTKRIRIKVRLINVESKRVMWAEQYDRVFDDIFDIQEDIAECAVATMAVQIEDIERRLARARNPESLDAYALQLRARDEILLNQAEARLRALELANKAISMSPDYARPHAMRSRALSLGWKYSWSEDPETSFADAHEAAMQAVSIDANDPRGLAELGSIALYRREHDRSLGAFSRALELNPSDADILV
ncbi:MAG: adenylate/guanylate cyclase domain-containing protein, partial [Pseudomonadota bacterium]